MRFLDVLAIAFIIFFIYKAYKYLKGDYKEDSIVDRNRKYVYVMKFIYKDGNIKEMRIYSNKKYENLYELEVGSRFIKSFNSGYIFYQKEGKVYIYTDKVKEIDFRIINVK